MSTILSVEEAIEILSRFQTAAPPSAAQKLSQVSELLREMDSKLKSPPAVFQESKPVVDLPVEEEPLFKPPIAPVPRTVTDQLAEIFQNINLEGPPPGRSDPPLQTKAPPPITVKGKQPPNEIKWQIEPEPEEEDTVQTTSRLKTAPLVDFTIPMKESIRPTAQLIRSQSDRLQKGQLGNLTTEQTMIIRGIRDHADGLLSLLDAFEQIIAISQGKFRLELSDFFCDELIERARALMLPTATSRNQVIEFHIASKTLKVHGDLEASTAILIDLLDNAIRYSLPGSVTRITLNHLGTHVLFNVADMGIGLSESDLKSVGKPFWRAIEQPLVRTTPGSGLRLFLAQRILGLQGGELIFSGELGVGSTFSFTLPVA